APDKLSLRVLGGAEPGGAESEGAGSGGAEPGGAEPEGAEPEGAEPGGAEPEGVEPRGAESEVAESGGAEPRVVCSEGFGQAAWPRDEVQQMQGTQSPPVCPQGRPCQEHTHPRRTEDRRTKTQQ
ncbi:unnamed protein product, partial [Closterium sp. NIES-53]